MMCETCDWEGALELAEEIQDEAEELPERAEDFASSVTETATDMATWIEENEHVTEAQETALENMRAGITKWQR
jgi:hypothetical protein